MELELTRTKSTDFSLTGRLTIDGIFKCYTLERPYNDPDHKPIPEGKYPVRMRESAFWKQHGYQMVPGIFDVPGRSDIEIHPGNRASDSHGCVLVGQQLGDDVILSSRLAFDPLLAILKETTDPVYIVIKKEIT